VGEGEEDRDMGVRVGEGRVEGGLRRCTWR
jgi:hypothetical protein